MLRGFAEVQVKPKRVLILYEVGTAYPGVNQTEEGLRAAFDTPHDKLEIYREYLETVLFPGQADQERLRQFYIRKYRDRPPDVIITVGPSPLKFMVETHKQAFPGVPIVFCLAAWVPSAVTLDSDFVGALNDLAPAETVEAAIHLRPDTKHIVVVGGTSYIDRQIEATVKEQLSRRYASRFDIYYLTNQTISDLLARLRHLPDHTIVLLTSFSRDARGATFIAGTEGTSLVTAAANAPVFVLYETFLNHGEVGGKLYSHRRQGTVAGELARRILNGEKPQNLPRINAGTFFEFDWLALKRWGMKEKNLPPGSIVLNRQLTVWEANKWYIVCGTSLIVLEALLISGLLWQRARKHHANLALQAREALLKIFVKNVPAGVAMLDRDMRYLQVSDRWCTDYGVEASQILGHSHYEIFPDVPAQWKEIHQRALNGETLRADEDRWDRKSGTNWVRWDVRPWLNMDAKPGGILIFAEEITRRKQADEALASVSKKLIESQDQERSRIARELHDDINQRLALLAVELDQFGQSSCTNDVQSRFQESKRRVIAIAGAVQSLSHRLHSSKLDYLGLVAAAKSFCREFSETHNVRVDFAQNGVPEQLPPEVALCLFRVLQEALQNAVKYSGANHFEVHLRGTSDDVCLAVQDFGRGFVVDEALRTNGLGLVSMRERVNLVKGEIMIKSKLMAGTEIIVHVPARIADSLSEVASKAA